MVPWLTKLELVVRLSVALVQLELMAIWQILLLLCLLLTDIILASFPLSWVPPVESSTFAQTLNLIYSDISVCTAQNEPKPQMHLLVNNVRLVICIFTSVQLVLKYLLSLPHRSANGGGIVVLGICVCVFVRWAATARHNAQPQLHAHCCPPSCDCMCVALVSAAKVMRCIQCSLIYLLSLFNFVNNTK